MLNAVLILFARKLIYLDSVNDVPISAKIAPAMAAMSKIKNILKPKDVDFFQMPSNYFFVLL
ncbi:hypothetical protein NBO_24g0026 [Nosema bombycis CQ1]|jgi:hypothetical protein|uniref:Uncharacterized protein n=1 Tax=Nosema bombycis (strain CQ1 / CVCC 102059) TaxID=578461 RepID=R0KUP0_NOSB1|nr:hypothetical protein NBO_24g0026 [Nosema bombycis CQ1]|eukprot:EOB14581.1 hypothetical protein NBO_24g0026 [Nosema bombycis CQ1]